ncbi:hypothetical protein OVY48_10820 [Sphingobium sp. SA2]|uniref:hypothetical protein n=1 Tax=Alphaproteobacteria TaxID=28211 RepID=UPI00178C5910|nr:MULTISPECIES: hypothetical protein [Alphaproteobacteria]MDT7533915.1 hypothetical protein [Sphingobium sp. SA2]
MAGPCLGGTPTIRRGDLPFGGGGSGSSANALPGGNEAGEHCRDAGLPVRDGRHFSVV